jgi:hypothetical protein
LPVAVYAPFAYEEELSDADIDRAMSALEVAAERLAIRSGAQAAIGQAGDGQQA